MKSLFQQISTSAEADKVIKDATLLLLILIGLQLLAELPFGSKIPIWKNIIFDSIDICFISLLRWQKKTIYCSLLIVMFLLTIFLHTKYLFSSSSGIITLFEYLFYIYVCIRAWKATRIIQGKSVFISYFLSNGYKWYFFIFLLGSVAIYIDIFVNKSATAIDYFDLPLSLIGVFGLFGYAFKKQIINAFAWKVYFVIIVFWDIFAFLACPRQPLIVEVNLGVQIISLIFVVCFALPYYLAIYLYGYKSMTIWNKTHNKALQGTGG
jgi:hypothetical protein